MYLLWLPGRAKLVAQSIFILQPRIYLLAFIRSDDIVNLYFSFSLVTYIAKIRKHTGFLPVFGREKREFLSFDCIRCIFLC